jgi:hypothetical protein
MSSLQVVRSRRPAKVVRALATIAALVVAVPALAQDGAAPPSSSQAGSTPPATSPGSESTVSGGLAATFKGPLGSSQGGIGIKVELGWSPLPALRIVASAEKVAAIGGVGCDCAKGPCCVGANPPYAWLGVGIEKHATPRRRVDAYVAAEVGTVARNAWRFAAKVLAGLDVRAGMMAFGFFGGALVAARDSLFNVNENYTVTLGLRALVVLPMR